MGTISAGVGLISGIDTQSLIAQLLAIDARPRDLMVGRISRLDAQRSALMDISARISAMLSSIGQFKNRSFFEATQITSSDPNVLTASADSTVLAGTYSFSVKQLATTQQLVSRGFTSSGAFLPAGALTIESADARVDSATTLDELNGFSGVRRGSFKLIDASGKEAVIDISDAVTLDEVIDQINQAGINVTADIEDDHLVLSETTGGRVEIQEMNGGSTARDLGFSTGNTVGVDGQIAGGELIRLADTSPLAALNDGLGVRHARAGGDFTINGMKVDLSGLLSSQTRIQRLNHGNGAELGTIRITTFDADGHESRADVDLSAAQTIADVEAAIESAVDGVAVTVTGGRLVVGYSDTSTTRRIEIEDVSGHAARDLGIAAESDSGKINGRDILLIDSAGDILDAINFADDNDGSISATIEGGRFAIHSSTGAVTLAEIAGADGTAASAALRDLGFETGTFAGGVASGSRVLAGLNTVLLRTLNGGQGIKAGVINIQANGQSVSVDLAGAETLREIIDRINAADANKTLGIRAGYDSTGTRLQIESLDGVTPITISDGDANQTATQLGIAGSGTLIRGSDLERRYLSENSALSSLNGGAGISLGRMQITDSSGRIATVDLTQGTFATLADVINAINNATTSTDDELGVVARINDTGDGLLLEDTAGGAGSLKVVDETGSSAADLRIAGESADGVLDGSYELTYELGGTETLQDLVNRINADNPLAQAALINDGTAYTPYRLQISAARSGQRAELIISDEGLGLDLTTLSRAQDARVVVGGNAGGGVLVTSSSNTISDAVPGLTINLVSASDETVTVSASQDDSNILSTLQQFVTSFNAALDRIRELGSYNIETESKGILFGESAVRIAENRLMKYIHSALGGMGGSLKRLSQLGFGFEEGQLVLDEEQFNAVFSQRREEVIDFFTDEENGLGAQLEETIEEITGDSGLFLQRDGSLEQQREGFGDRVDDLNELLARKQLRYERQFQAMETALANLQAQQGALTQLSALVAQMSRA